MPADRGLVDTDGLIDILKAADNLVRGRQFARAVELPGKGAIERVIDQGALTRTGETPVTTVITFKGNSTVRFLRL